MIPVPAEPVLSVEQSFGTRLIGKTGFRIAAVVLTIICLCAIAPGPIAAVAPGSDDPRDCSIRADDGTYQDNLVPSSDHWFGTDGQGCDVFTRVVHGARASLAIGLGTGLLATGFGVAAGVLAGWRGGFVDAAVRRTGDVTLGLPLVLGAILLLSVLSGQQRSPAHLVLALAALLWPAPARVARTATRALRDLEFIEASRAQGAGDGRLMVSHVLPNVLPTVIAYATPSVGLVIGAEATLTYLGIGLRIPAISWGLMIERAQVQYASTPHLLLLPGLFLVATVVAFILLGDAMSDALDPRRSIR